MDSNRHHSTRSAGWPYSSRLANSLRCAILLLAVNSHCVAQQNSGFDGAWVFRLNGQNIFKLTLATERGVVIGSLTKPKP